MPDSFMRIDPADFKVWDQPDSKVLDPRGAAPTSAAGLGCSPLPHLHQDSARPFLHLHRDWAHLRSHCRRWDG